MFLQTVVKPLCSVRDKHLVSLTSRSKSVISFENQGLMAGSLFYDAKSEVNLNLYSKKSKSIQNPNFLCFPLSKVHALSWQLIYAKYSLETRINVAPNLSFWRKNSHQHALIRTTTLINFSTKFRPINKFILTTTFIWSTRICHLLLKPGLAESI